MRRIFILLIALIAIILLAVFAWGYAPDMPLAQLKAKYANAESEFVDIGDGFTIHLRDEGPTDAPAIILLHGSNASLHTWEQWTQSLKGTYRIIRFDQPGHGLTGPHPTDDYTAQGFVDVVDKIAKNRGLDTFYLGGNSMGGWITHEYAKRFPERLKGIILVDAGGAPNSKPRQLPIGFRLALTPGLNQIATVITPRSLVETSLQQSVSNQAIVTKAEVDEYWELLRRPGNRDATFKRFAQYGNRNTPEPVPAATQKLPALIIWGKEDRLIPVTSAKWFETQYKDNVTQIYTGIGHLPMEETATESAALVGNWLAKKPQPVASQVR